MKNCWLLCSSTLMFAAVGIGCFAESPAEPLDWDWGSDSEPRSELCADLNCGDGGACEIVDNEETCVCDADHDFDGELCVTKQSYNIVYKDWSNGAKIFLGNTITGARRVLLGLDGGIGARVEVSPSGSAIAFTTYHDDSWQLYAMNLTDESVTHLAPSSSEPSWSPDGKKIAFINYETGTSEVRTIQLDGSQKRLTTVRGHASSCSDVEWSPSGDTLIFSALRGKSREGVIYSVDVASGERTSIYAAADTNSICFMAWSHDGTQIAFTRWSEAYSGWELTTINADGSNPQMRVQLQAGIGETKNRWSPDDAAIAFVDFDYDAPGGGGEGVLKTLDLADDTVTRVASVTNVYGGHVRWAPNGEFLLYTTFDYDFGSARLMTVPRGGGEPTPRLLLKGGIGWGFPSWVPSSAAINKF